jgi:hypothetical protein
MVGVNPYVSRAVPKKSSTSPTVNAPTRISSPGSPNKSDLLTSSQIKRASEIAANPTLGGVNTITNNDYGGDYIIVTPQTAADISSAGAATAANLLSPSTAKTTDPSVIQTLASVGVNFKPQQNPLNSYANYTYHIRWFLTTEADAYSMQPIKSVVDATSKTIIAESGVTAGFNIIDLEINNICAPNAKTMNTTMTDWTMTVAEPFGLSLIDKIRSAALTQPVIQYMRAPYFIDIWFTGYDEEGTVVDLSSMYQIYRVSLNDMSVKVTEGGGIYSITGIFDGMIGHSNEISIPPSGITIRAKNLEEFFAGLKSTLNDIQKNTNEQNFPLVEYDFVLPQEMKSWTLKSSEVDKQSDRYGDMDVSYKDGTTTFKSGNGTSIENICNYVVAMCPKVADWIKGSGQSTTGGALLTSEGIGTWPMIHSSVAIIGWDAYTGDYIRKITYSLIPYNTIKVAGDRDTVDILLNEQVQAAKLRYLTLQNALVKQYNYIYTGLNTEVLHYDIQIDNLWQLVLPQWEATNTYHNYTQGPQYANSTGDLINKGLYTKKQQYADLQKQISALDAQASTATTESQAIGASQKSLALSAVATDINTSMNSAVYIDNSSPGKLVANSAGLKNKNIAKQVASFSILSAARQNNTNKAKLYAEKIAAIPISVDPMPVIIRQTNNPTMQIADQGSDSNKAMPDSSQTAIPASRSFVGAVLGNMFSQQSFLNIELEIRGDPYWLGQSNILDDTMAIAMNTLKADKNFANFLSRDNMFILNFRTGENYNEDTGLMQFDTSSDFFNGAYCVTEVTNKFKSGSFTQSLKAYKDPFSQKPTLTKTANGTSSSKG